MAYTKAEDERVDKLDEAIRGKRLQTREDMFASETDKERKRLEYRDAALSEVQKLVFEVFELEFIRDEEFVEKSDATGIKWKYIYGRNRRGQRRIMDIELAEKTEFKPCTSCLADSTK